MRRPATAAELILYAVPAGELARVCDTYWRRVVDSGRATTAQTYPPHCTLTGFFRRAEERIPAVVAEFDVAVPVAKRTVVDVDASLRCGEDWVGLELRSPSLHGVTAAFVDSHVALAGEDALRPKSWLHLSLAYDEGFDASWHAGLARDVVTELPASPWTIGLWRRHDDGSWAEIAGPG